MELNELKAKIITASDNYYSGNGTISDDEFDALVEQLAEISPNDPLLSQVSYGYSPTGADGEKASHKYQKVGSLNKINTETCEKYFAKQTVKDYCITSKIDGGSIVSYYDSKGRLEKAITRGNGEVGIDCTAKLRHLVPASVGLSDVAVRGEVIMSKDNFEKYYPNAASPRNMAVGIIGRDDVNTEEVKRLAFVTYNVYGDNYLIPKTKSGRMDWLADNDFTVALYTKTFSTELGTLESMKGILNPEFPADGLVITNEYDPEDQIAYKFVAETAETTVTGIKWTMSRLGYLIPVINFNPVKLSGATLSKCSGFNARWVADNGIGIGAKIIIHRAGEIIPYITKVISSEGYITPEYCPICDTLLEWNGVHKYCWNNNCQSKTKHKFFKWYEMLAQIDNLGENILEPFFTAMNWKEISDIYNTSKERWEEIIIQNFTTNHARILLWTLYEKLFEEPVNPDNFIAAFGLPAAGGGTSKRISEEISLENYFGDDGLDETTHVLQMILKLSKTTEPAIKSLWYYFGTMKRVYLQIMSRQGFVQKQAANTKIKIAVTGKLSKPRKEFAEEMAAYGIEVGESISKDVMYLITEDPTSGSSKNLKAQKLGVKVISEIDFRKEMKI